MNLGVLIVSQSFIPWIPLLLAVRGRLTNALHYAFICVIIVIAALIIIMALLRGDYSFAGIETLIIMVFIIMMWRIRPRRRKRVKRELGAKSRAVIMRLLRSAVGRSWRANRRPAAAPA